MQIHIFARFPKDLNMSKINLDVFFFLLMHVRIWWNDDLHAQIQTCVLIPIFLAVFDSNWT